MMDSESSALVIFVTAGSEIEAENIAMALVQDRLTACVSIVPKIRSIYIWEEKLEKEEEILLIIKTREALFERVRGRVKELHSYSVPEIIALPVTNALKEYLDWIFEVTV
ncbi:MAG: divalent-cation tolerance protein CutA [Deltaproteobacteria bacterium]|uniref:Divalent-cation tolerance protein CutA n=1 Tax=Candidatus Zymogenus saltonus TaxID=2844893 RepID=A0A9D8KDP7_9DELT|nr:divalent-cation tolerance protein CutA [Candidatus Zymogenus saltonus]